MNRLVCGALAGFALLVCGLTWANTTRTLELPDGLERNDWRSIEAVWQAGQHAVHAASDQPGTWTARNQAQQWTTRFDGRGFDTHPSGQQWHWGLALKRWGFAGAEQAVEGAATVSSNGPRIDYRWSDTLEEWYINDGRGLEHGYTVHQRPQGMGDQLRFELAVRGDLRAQIGDGGRDVHFLDAQGAAALNYTGLKVWDADGALLDAVFEPLADGLALAVNTANARYPITIDPLAQQAYLKASNSGSMDQFGFSVAVSGDTVVVGAPWEASATTGVNSTPDDAANYSGAAYVFVRSAGVWSQQAYLKASNTGASDEFGRSVAISGDTVVVGAFGENSSTTGVNSTPDEAADQSGAAYVFVRSGTTWSQQAFLKASNTQTDDNFGLSVAVSADTVLVGAQWEDSSTTGVNSVPNEDAGFSGAAYVFVRNGTAWSQQAYLKASNTGAFDYFGLSVAVEGNTAVIGARGEDSSTTGVGSTPDEAADESGAAYVFVRSGTTWSQQAYLKAGNTETGDNFGSSVAVSGDTVVVGAYLEDSGTTGVNSVPNESGFRSGAAYVFVRTGGAWSQQAYLKASNTGVWDMFGLAVAVSGDTAVVGAYFEASGTTGVNSTPDEAASQSGAAYVFVRNADVWSQQAYLKAGNTGASDHFGQSVAVSGDTVIVGAPQENSSTTGANSAPNELATYSGAAYLFAVPSLSVGGTVSGLAAGNSLALQNNGGDDLLVSGNGGFTFAGLFFAGAGYAVTVQTQPTTPGQICLVSNGNGTLAGSNITNVSVICTTNTYNVGGAVSGLETGNSVVLRNNGGDSRTVNANGSFTFSTPLSDGSAYAVTVQTQPTTPNQTCAISNGSGTLNGSNISNVQVVCTTNTYSVGGTVSGLATGNSVVLRNNGGDNRTVNANGSFAFSTPLSDGGAYAVTVQTQPTTPNQTCAISNGSGTLNGSNISNVSVICTTNTYSVGGTVSGLAAGNSVVLRNNGGDSRTVNANGAFTFSTPVSDGGAYAVTVQTQPSTPIQQCTISSGTSSGVVAGAAVSSVAVNCVSGAITVSTAALSFAVDQLGDVSPAQSVQVTSSASVPLQIQTVSLSGAQASHFSIFSNTCTGATLAQSESCEIRVDYAPLSTLGSKANLMIPSSDADGTSVVSLTGVVIRIFADGFE